MMDNIEEINNDLDQLSDEVFSSAGEAWEAIALKLESYGIIPPAADGFDDEMLFRFEDDTEEYLYVNMDGLDEDQVTVYAIFVDPEELGILDGAEDEPQPQVIPTHVRTRKTSSVS